MKLLRNRLTQDGDGRVYTTEDLPIRQTDVTLYTSIWGDKVIKKFRKEQPEVYVGVEALLKDPDFSKAAKVIVRELGTGYLPVLLVKARPNLRVQISTWVADTGLAERNASENYVESRVDIVVESSISGSAEVGIMVQSGYQNQSTITEELSQLMKCSRNGIVFLVSHHKKGADLLSEKASVELGLEFDTIARGIGGVRVFKFKRTPHTRSSGTGSGFSSGVSYIYEIGGYRIPIRASGSLFSKTQIDTGTDMLIRFALSMYTNTNASLRVYDMGCGAGVIGITILTVFRNSHVVMSDVDSRAVEMANINVKSLDLANRAEVKLSDGPEKIRGDFDMILSNPPLHLRRPRLIEMIGHARRLLKKGGKMLLVIENSRTKEIQQLLEDRGIYARLVYDGGSHCILEVKK